MEEKGLVANGIQGGFASIASAFVIESLNHMIPWLIVMFAVIVTDLLFGVRKSIAFHEEVRFSKAMRCTMGKCVTYFAFVVMVCMINTAMGNTFHIDRWACLLVCFVEGCSIIGNYLKPKGIDFNVVGAIRLAVSKVAKVDKRELSGIVRKGRKRKETKDETRN